tara:strand:- start:11401 stop:12354 length:954 start_codon:yes stop_codon:yes gene_type:complete
MISILNKIHPAFVILFACLLWATDIFVRYPVTLKLESQHIIFWENLFGLVVFLPFLNKSKLKDLLDINLKEFLMLLFLALFGSTIAGYFFNISIQLASPNTFSFLQVFQPLLVVALASYFLKEKFDQLFIVWGMWIILSALIIQSNEIELGTIFIDFTNHPKAILMGLAAMLIWGICTVIGKKLLEKHTPYKIFMWRWIMSTCFTGMVFITAKKDFDYSLMTEPVFIFRVLYIGIICGSLAMWFYYHGLKRLKASTTSFVELAYPVFGMIFASFQTFGKMTFLQILGLVSLVFAVTILVNNSEDESGNEIKDKGTHF